MTRVLHVLDAGRPGDAGAYLAEHVRHASAEIELLLWTPRHPTPPHETWAATAFENTPAFASGLVKAMRLLPLEAIEQRWDSLNGIRRLARAMAQEAIHVVHAHDPRSARIATLAAAWARVPVVFRSEYEIVAPGALQGAVRFLEGLALRLTARALCVCEEVRRSHAVRHPWAADRFVTVHGGVSGPPVVRDRRAVRAELAIGADEPVVLAAGPLVASGGHLVLLEAFRRANAVRPGARLVIAGTGPLRAELERRAQEWELGAAVTITDLDARDLVAAADVFAFAGLRAGLPPPLLEALRAARPIVASRVGGVPEAVQDGVSGWLVPPGDPFSAAEAMLHLLVNRERARAMGAAGRARWERDYTGARMVAEIERRYRTSRAYAARVARARAVDDLRGTARQNP